VLEHGRVAPAEPAKVTRHAVAKGGVLRLVTVEGIDEFLKKKKKKGGLP